MSSPDVVVIGGGIAGASVAYELAAQRSVLLLEAESELARHATARSAATWIPGHGVDVVRALIAASGPRFARLAAELDAPPLLTPRPVLWIATDAPGERSLAELLAERAGEPDAPVPVAVGEAERRCPALAPGRIRAAGLTEHAADVDTDALHQAYVRGLRARGGRVRSGAPVISLRPYGTGWRVEAGGQVHHATDVVDAAGAWADEVAALAGVPRIGLTPLRRTIAVARVPDAARLRVPHGRPPMVIEAGERFYFKSEGEDLLVSPGDESPSEPRDARPDELDVAIALERVEAVTALGLRSVRTSWAGLRSFVADRRPVVGSWPEHPGFWFLAGQGGSGIETAPALAALAAAVVSGSPAPADVAVAAAALAPTRL
jgi:D-arginine dehydrogenase